MARKVKEFDMFGVKYRATQFAAVAGIAMMSAIAAASPVDILSGCEVFAHTADKPEGEWLPLNSDRINEFVVDRAGILSPSQALNLLVEVVSDFNFDFVKKWTGVRIPSRFLDDTVSVKSAHASGMISALISSDTASLKELEEYYSPRDAFAMFDIITAKGVNEALSSEAAMKRAKQ